MPFTTVPVSDVDLFSADVLLDPFPAYARLREAGPVVRLSRLDVWALPRYEQVRAALRDHETFSSAAGVGFFDQMNQLMAGGILASDPPRHTARGSGTWARRSRRYRLRAAASMGEDGIGGRASLVAGNGSVENSHRSARTPPAAREHSANPATTTQQVTASHKDFAASLLKMPSDQEAK